MSTPLGRDEVRQLEAMEADELEHMLTVLPDDLGASLGFGFERIGSAAVCWASGIDTLLYNRAFGLGLSEPVSEALLDRIVERFRQVGAPRFFVQAAPGAEPAALSAWLEARGLTLYNRWAKLHRGIEPPPEPRSDLDVRQIDRTHARAFGEVVAGAFGHDPALGAWYAGLVGLDGWRHYAAFDGEALVATAAMLVVHDIAHFSFAATRDTHRGRGAQSALIARRIRDATELGCRRLVVETAEDLPDKPSPSFRNVRRLGFELAYLRPNYLGTASVER